MDPEPFDEPLKIVELMSGFGKPWYLAGGWAIDLFLGRVRRYHKDIDIAVFREDQLALQKHLAGWDLRKVLDDGRVEPWLPGERLELPTFQVFVQTGTDGFARKEILLNDRSGDEWWWRRNPDVKRPLAAFGLRTKLGVPIVSPEIVMLFKSRHVYGGWSSPDGGYEHLKQNDEADFQAVNPLLTADQRRWLKHAIQLNYPGHHWLAQL